MAITAQAFSELLRQCIDDAKANKRGVYGTDLSDELKRKFDDDWEKIFGKDAN